VIRLLLLLCGPGACRLQRSQVPLGLPQLLLQLGVLRLQLGLLLREPSHRLAR
jgi:hypothetical protein